MPAHPEHDAVTMGRAFSFLLQHVAPPRQAAAGGDSSSRPIKSPPDVRPGARWQRPCRALMAGFSTTHYCFFTHPNKNLRVAIPRRCFQILISLLVPLGWQRGRGRHCIKMGVVTGAVGYPPMTATSFCSFFRKSRAGGSYAQTLRTRVSIGSACFCFDQLCLRDSRYDLLCRIVVQILHVLPG